MSRFFSAFLSALVSEVKGVSASFEAYINFESICWSRTMLSVLVKVMRMVVVMSFDFTVAGSGYAQSLQEVMKQRGLREKELLVEA